MSQRPCEISLDYRTDLFPGAATQMGLEYANNTSERHVIESIRVQRSWAPTPDPIIEKDNIRWRVDPNDSVTASPLRVPLPEASTSTRA